MRYKEKLLKNEKDETTEQEWTVSELSKNEQVSSKEQRRRNMFICSL